MRESTRLQRSVVISMAAFTPFGITLIADDLTSTSLVIPLCDGWVGEFARIEPTSPVFALRTVRPATEQDRRRSVCGLDALWRRPEFREADRAISAFLPLTRPNLRFAPPAATGSDRHEA